MASRAIRSSRPGTAAGPPSPASAARRFQALAEEKRLQIVALLRNGERCVCELTECVDAGQSLLSFHLKTLREAGLVRSRRVGKWVYYTLEEEALDELAGYLDDLGAGIAPGCC